MYLYNLIKDIDGDVSIYVDMDGVLVDFDVTDKKDIENNTEDYFLNRRPINAVIEVFKKIKIDFPAVELNILSSCRFLDQADDKKKWLEIHAPFFDNINFTVRSLHDFELTRVLKAQMLKENFDENKTIILIDDTHSVLREVHKELEGKVKVIHVTSIFE